jgi:phosphatidylinositol alpha-1,6-mannosyltransferase
VGWAVLPAARQALRRIGDGCDAITYLGEYTHSRIAKAFGAHPQFVQLPPGVDTTTFHPGVDGSAVRERHGLVGRPVIVCVSRLVARKGQDTLIEALPTIRRQVPDAALLIVGRGPYHEELRGLADKHGVSEHVAFTGGVAAEELPAHYAAGDVFAMPCRTRRAGLDVEGLGIVYLEASATGLPVLAGDSGGAPDAVQDGVTGYVVGGRDVAAVARRLVLLLGDSSLRARLGSAGRAWVEREWQWDVLAARLGGLLRAD